MKPKYKYCIRRFIRTCWTISYRARVQSVQPPKLLISATWDRSRYATIFSNTHSYLLNALMHIFDFTSICQMQIRDWMVRSTDIISEMSIQTIDDITLYKMTLKYTADIFQWCADNLTVEVFQQCHAHLHPNAPLNDLMNSTL